MATGLFLLAAAFLVLLVSAGVTDGFKVSCGPAGDLYDPLGCAHPAWLPTISAAFLLFVGGAATLVTGWITAWRAWGRTS